MRYVMARYREYQREMAYRIYNSDALRIISENTARLGGGSYMQLRYADIISFGKNGVSDNRTEEEIISHLFDKLRKVRGGEEL